MMEEIRSFIAVEIPEVLRQKLREFLRDLKTTGADVKWVRPEGIHLTLKFLGPVRQDVLEKITSSLRPVAEKFFPFEMRAERCGCFPSLRNPRVVWAGLTDREGALLRLHREIEAAAAELGLSPEDRPFQPHLTLGRVRSPKGKIPLAQKIEGNARLDLGSFPVERVILFRSDLRPEGAVYTKLQEFSFKGI
jgi:RNA 2',3'-cyclic 3'-phosphodiesterase